MQQAKRTRSAAVAALTAGLLLVGAAPALAHGGSVDPPTEQQDCRNLELFDKGEGGHAKEGLTTAGDHSSTTTWGHCGG